MTNKKIIEMFNKAHSEGFVSDLETSDCNSECCGCPAGDACDFLSTDIKGKSTSSIFVKNYKLLRSGTLIEDEGVEDHD